MNQIKTVSISARVLIDMHALNNEGSESNRLMTRQVGIVTPDVDEQGEPGYRRSTVNAISGDMNKHIFMDYLRHIALDRGLPLCPACVDLDPSRMMANPGFEDWVKTKPSGVEIVDRLISCTLDDIGGTLITAGSNSIKRKSAVEFGWTIGLPDITEVQEFIHARHAVRRVTRTKAGRDASEETKKQAVEEKEANLGQMIFDRPASSGVYAFVAHIDVGAIGFNDISGEYPAEVPSWDGSEMVPVDRASRLQAALLAMAQTLLQPRGALTSTQLPHVLDVEGFVSVSASAASAPIISPLVDDYYQRAVNVADMLNRMHRDSVEILPFAGQAALLEQMAGIIDNTDPGRYGGY